MEERRARGDDRSESLRAVQWYRRGGIHKAIPLSMWCQGGTKRCFTKMCRISGRKRAPRRCIVPQQSVQSTLSSDGASILRAVLRWHRTFDS